MPRLATVGGFRKAPEEDARVSGAESKPMSYSNAENRRLLLCLAMWLALSLTPFGGAPGVKAQPSGPPVPFEDVGACPFEGCVYREWTARAEVRVRAGRRAGAPVVFQLRAGERVTALTGVVVTVRAGQVRFDAPQRLATSGGPIDVSPQQTLYLLTYQGEGFIKVWFDGKVYEDVDATGFLGDACEGANHRCSGRVVVPSRTEWWVQIRNKAGQVGWTREPDKFDGKDFLG